MPSLKTCFTAAALACAVSAETIKVTAKSDNTFDPDTVHAKAQDVLEFHFEPSNHSVVSGDYAYPCSAQDVGKGFFSGFVPVDDGESDKVFRYTVTDTQPIPFYSSQSDECAKGMAGIINPTDDKNLKNYKQRASELSRAITPGKKPYGGDLVVKDSNEGAEDKDSDKDSDDGNGKSAAGTVGTSILAAVGAAVLTMLML